MSRIPKGWGDHRELVTVFDCVCIQTGVRCLSFRPGRAKFGPKGCCCYGPHWDGSAWLPDPQRQIWKAAQWCHHQAQIPRRKQGLLFFLKKIELFVFADLWWFSFSPLRTDFGSILNLSGRKMYRYLFLKSNLIWDSKSEITKLRLRSCMNQKKEYALKVSWKLATHLRDDTMCKLLSGRVPRI